MPDANRKERLAADLEAMRALTKASSHFEFECSGDPPDRYTVILHGKGLARDMARSASVDVVEIHRCDVRLPFSYPDRPPDIRWLSPIFHPNVSFSGYVNARDIGITWHASMSLDVVCERLWDVARLAYVDLDQANNYRAKQWFESQTEYSFPLDPRPLRNATAPSGSNVVKYERRGPRRVPVDQGDEAADVFFIGEDTPVPVMPRRMPRRRNRGDEDILYIGDDD